MARILRGEIRWADLGPVRGREQQGRRAVLVVSHNVFNDRSGTVIVMAITSRPQKAGFPLTLELEASRLPHPSWVKISQVRTLAVERLGRLAGVASDEEMARAVEGLNEIVVG